MKSAVLLTHGIGDVIMHLPLLRALLGKRDDRVVVLTKTETESGLVKMLLGQDARLQVWSVHGDHRGRITRFLRLCGRLRDFRPEAVVTSFNTDPILAGILSLFSGATTRVGPRTGLGKLLFNNFMPSYAEFEGIGHKVDYGLLAAEKCGREGTPSFAASLATVLRDDEKSDFKMLPSPYACIALGSGLKEAHKRLPPEIAGEMIHRLSRNNSDLTFVFLGTSSEADMNRALAKRAQGKGIDLTASTSLPDAIRILKNAEFLISTCNGISHLASVANTPVIGLFGPTNPRLTGPYGVDLRIVSRGLDCSPCYSRQMPYGCGTPKCMNLEVGQIVTQVDKLRAGLIKPAREL